MRNIHRAIVFIQIVFLVSHMPPRCHAESTTTEKSTSTQTETEKTTTPENTKPRVTETQKTTTTKQRESKKTRKSHLLESSQWNQRTLKSTDFTTRVSEDHPKVPCKPPKVQDILKRRKQEYEQDPSVIQFVSADPLPVNESSLQEESCYLQARRSRAKKGHKPRSRVRAAAPVPSPAPAPAPAPAVAAVAEPQEAKRPCRVGEKGDECDINDRVPEIGSSSYEFPSVEYYDEDVIHNVKDCPNDMETITLDLQELRQYDYQCEVLTRWTGLE